MSDIVQIRAFIEVLLLLAISSLTFGSAGFSTINIFGRRECELPLSVPQTIFELALVDATIRICHHPLSSYAPLHELALVHISIRILVFPPAMHTTVQEIAHIDTAIRERIKTPFPFSVQVCPIKMRPVRVDVEVGVRVWRLFAAAGRSLQ